MQKGKALFVTLALILAFVYLFTSPFFIKHKIKTPVEVEIPEGMTFRAVAQLLNRHGVLANRNIFIFWGRILGLQYSIKSGIYRFDKPLSDYEILKKITRGDVELIKVTIPEGFNLWQIAERLERLGITQREKFLTAAKDKKLLSELKISAPSAEGYLFPDTYLFPKNCSPERIIKEMVKNLRAHITEDMKVRARRLGLTEREFLTLASIIEKEAELDEERPLISAVFHNRLNRGIPLESDPTTVYGVVPPPERITRKDLKRKSPYNTYLIKGLPPGPIASPGIKSIQAALNPARVPYLFFVAIGDGKHHHFSTTNHEHQKAIKKYRSHQPKQP